MANVCNKCRAENSQDNAFCGSCGTPLSIAENVQSKMISFPDAIKLAFQRSFDFKGRSTRAEYWWFALFWVLVTFVLAGIDEATGTFSSESGFGFLSGLWIVVTLIPELSLGIRRLHDINKSGKLILLGLPMYLDYLVPLHDLILFVAFVMLLPLFWWAIQPSNKQTNKYTPPL